MADMFSSMQRGDESVYDGKSYFYTTRTPDGAYMLISSDGGVLLMPDPNTGFPRMPTADMMRQAQREQNLVLRSSCMDIDRSPLIEDSTELMLLPPPSFISRIRF